MTDPLEADARAKIASHALMDMAKSPNSYVAAWTATLQVARDAIEELLLIARSARPGWEPISTAPRDGTVILGWREGLPRAMTFFWREKVYDRSGPRWGHTGSHSISREMATQPTVWLPLPAAPQTDSAPVGISTANDAEADVFCESAAEPWRKLKGVRPAPQTDGEGQ